MSIRANITVTSSEEDEGRENSLSCGMLSPTETVIRETVDEVLASYDASYGLLEPELPNIAAWAIRTSLELIRLSDALYHNVEHTAQVVSVGLEIIRGRHIKKGGVSPSDWLNYVVALGCHDIGYVRGVCLDDKEGRYVTGIGDDYVDLVGVTDASLTPYHVDRGKRFVRQRFSDRPYLGVDEICRNIDHTRFPVPTSEDSTETDDYPALVRAADLIGQLGDPRYLQKLPALYYEFHETGTTETLGVSNPLELRENYPAFFWNVVRPYIADAIAYLKVTSAGQQWVANLHSNVFEVEHER